MAFVFMKFENERLEPFNAARMSAAGDGWTEPIHNYLSQK